MAEYINCEVAFDAITELAGKATTRSAYEAIWKSAKVLKKIPVADVAPVVHGEWSENKEHIYLANGEWKEWINFYCSECDAPNNSPTDYCPHCGARMDGGADNV